MTPFFCPMPQRHTVYPPWPPESRRQQPISAPESWLTALGLGPTVINQKVQMTVSNVLLNTEHGGIIHKIRIPLPCYCHIYLMCGRVRTHTHALISPPLQFPLQIVRYSLMNKSMYDRVFIFRACCDEKCKNSKEVLTKNECLALQVPVDILLLKWPHL